MIANSRYSHFPHKKLSWLRFLSVCITFRGSNGQEGSCVWCIMNPYIPVFHSLKFQRLGTSGIPQEQDSTFVRTLIISFLIKPSFKSHICAMLTSFSSFSLPSKLPHAPTPKHGFFILLDIFVLCYIGVPYLLVCVCTVCTPGVDEGQKKAPDPV